jgi:hypothetical protein
MTGIHADWLTDPKKVRIVVASVFALAMVVRAIAGVLVQRLLKINRSKRGFRYRIPLTLVHRRRSRMGGAPLRPTRRGDNAATANRSVP